MDQKTSNALSQSEVFIGNEREIAVKLSCFPAETIFMTLVLPCLKHPEFAIHVGSATVDLLSSLDDGGSVPSGVEIWTYISNMLLKKLPSSAKFREMRMLAHAIAGVLQSEDFVTASAIVELTSVSNSHTDAQPKEWRRDKEIFSIGICGEDYYPLYALQPFDNFRPHRNLKDIIELFDGIKDGWGMAFWFLSANSYLGGRAPKDMLSLNSSLVIEAARAEMNEILHG